MADRATDVLVVGGGVLGLGHAIAAVRAGHRVTLCERNAAARGASVRNFGMIWPVGQPAGPDRDLALRSRELWAEIAAEAGFPIRACGSMHLARADDEWRVLQEFVAGSGLPELQLVAPEDVVRAQPHVVTGELRGGMFSPFEANVDPAVAIASMHTWLLRQGVAIHYECPVRSVAEHAVELATGDRLRAEHVVVCTGDDFATLLPEVYADAGLLRCKLQMLSFGPQPAGFDLGPMLAAGLTLLHYDGFADCASLPALRARLDEQLPEHRAAGIHVMVSQGDDGRLIVGDSHDYRAPFRPGLDESVERWIVDYLRGFLRLPADRVLRRWSGTYAKRSDGGATFRARPLAGVEVVTGVGGSGMTRSMALGEQTVRSWGR